MIYVYQDWRKPLNKKEFTHIRDNSREIKIVRPNGHVLNRWPFEMRASTPNEKKKPRNWTFDEESIISNDNSNLGKENLFKGKSLEYTDSESINNNNNNNNNNNSNTINHNSKSSTNPLMSSIISTSSFYNTRERFNKTASMNRSILISSKNAKNIIGRNESSLMTTMMKCKKINTTTTTTTTATSLNNIKSKMMTKASSKSTIKMESNQFIKIALESCQLIKDYNDMLVGVVDTSNDAHCGGGDGGNKIDMSKLDDEFELLTSNLTNEDLKSGDIDICSLCGVTNANNVTDIFLMI